MPVIIVSFLGNVGMTTIGIGLIASIVMAYLGYRVVKGIITPIGRLVVVTDKLAAGDLDADLDTGSKSGELGQVNGSLAKMVANIKDRIQYSESILKGIMDPLYVVDPRQDHLRQRARRKAVRGLRAGADGQKPGGPVQHRGNQVGRFLPDPLPAVRRGTERLREHARHQEDRQKDYHPGKHCPGQGCQWPHHRRRGAPAGHFADQGSRGGDAEGGAGHEGQSGLQRRRPQEHPG